MTDPPLLDPRHKVELDTRLEHGLYPLLETQLEAELDYVLDTRRKARLDPATHSGFAHVTRSAS
jgi:hypothetical protein